MSYLAEDPSVRHLGPTAQDFRAAFGLGIDDVSIGTVDADGVALAAAKALAARTDHLKAELAQVGGENAALRDQVSALRKENAELEARMKRLEQLLVK